MILIDEITIKEFRGIRDLTLPLGGKNFAVCGPNGTGKSGIVDALEFALTGNISRLSGTGTGGLSVKDHGPHVDSRNKPENAWVSVQVQIPSLKKKATIKRRVKDAKTLEIVPNDPDIRSVLSKVEWHPEIVLSRRELIRYVLAEPGKRSKEVQELLRLDEVETLRALFQKISNACDKDVKTQKRSKDDTGAALQKALGLTKLASSEIVAAANSKRTTLSLPPLTGLEANTSIKDGIASASAAATATKITKQQAKNDIDLLRQAIDQIGSAEIDASCDKALIAINGLEQNEEFLHAASRETLIKSALAAFDNEFCPVCDTPWSPSDFRDLLESKLKKFSEASKQRGGLEKELSPLSLGLNTLRNRLTQITKYGELLEPKIDCSAVEGYVALLEQMINQVRSILPLGDTKASIAQSRTIQKGVLDCISALDSAVSKLPEPSQQDAAREFLIVGQEKLEAYRQALQKLREAEKKASTAEAVFATYGKVTTEALEAIYKNVEGTFSELYRLVHHDDESKFEAQLTPSLGKLGFNVDFYGRGFFPPGAYHSEGHQDGMGLCLYLALMQHLSGDAFTFAVLDDVLMSVDAGHRREVSRMLQDRFPKTQFFLTTHDEIWLKHMKAVGLIAPKSCAHFRTWDVDIGPTEWDEKDVWDRIEQELAKNDVRSAAALLRNYLEYISKELCHGLRASVVFRGDAQFTLGDLLPSAISKLRKYLKAGKTAADSWGQAEKAEAITARENDFNQLAAASQAEQWQMNAMVHYNEWADLQRNEFEPVVKNFRQLLEAFKCNKCHCLLHVLPEFGTEELLKCNCGECNINLKKKS